MPDREREKYVEQFCRELEEQNRHPYVIRNRASTALGSLGYVQAVVELCEQCAGRGIEIKHLFVPGGNGGLAAGVIFGTALVEAPFHVHVVTVEHENRSRRKFLCGFIRDLQELTGSLAGASFDDLYTIHEEYRGEGWGIPTPESVDWIHDLARTEGHLCRKGLYEQNALRHVGFDTKREALTEAPVISIQADSARFSASSETL